VKEGRVEHSSEDVSREEKNLNGGKRRLIIMYEVQWGGGVTISVQLSSAPPLGEDLVR